MNILRATKLKYGAIHSADPKPMCLFRHIRCPLLISLDIHAFLTVVNLKVSYDLPNL